MTALTSCRTTTVASRTEMVELLKFRNILAPTDFSRASSSAIRYAAELARQSSARLHLLHVVDIPTMADPFPGNPAMMAPPEAAVRESKEALASLVQSLPDQPCVTVTRFGSPVTEILDYADEAEIDLIVMATAGRKGLARMLVGSTTEGVVRRAMCPVLSFRHPERVGVDEGTESSPQPDAQGGA